MHVVSKIMFIMAFYALKTILGNACRQICYYIAQFHQLNKVRFKLLPFAYYYFWKMLLVLFFRDYDLTLT